MVDVAQLGYEVETSQVLKGEQALDELTESTLNADAASKKLAKSSGTAGAAVGGMAARTANLNKASLLASGGLRQVSLNLSQVAQQGAVTGNYLQALTVQAADIGIVFGTAGIAAGALISVLGPMAIALFDSGDAADDLESAMDNLSDAVDTLNQPLDVLNLTMDELIAKYGDAAQKVREFARVQAELAISQAERRLADQVDIVDDLADAYRRAREQGPGFVADLEGISREFGVTAEEADQLFRAFVQFDQARTFDQQESALNRIVETMTAADVELSKLPPELQDAISEMITLQRETAAAEKLMQNLASAAAGVTFGDRDALAGLSGSELLPSAGDLGDPDKPGRRRGGGRTDRFEQDLNRLVQSLETERETLEREYAEREALLNDFRAREFLSEEAHKQALLRLEEEYHDSLRDLGVNASNQRLQEVSGFFGAMEQLALNSGKGLAKAAAVFGGIEATINAYRAAAQALADPSVPFYAKAAAYASVLATGLGAAKAIRSAGAKIGAAGGGGEGGADGVSAAPQQDFTNIRLEFVGGDNPDIIQAIWEEMLGRAQASSREGVIIEVARA